jgi:hypothetical protein
LITLIALELYTPSSIAFTPSMPSERLSPAVLVALITLACGRKIADHFEAIYEETGQN